jgi:hypothetical protein
MYQNLNPGWTFVLLSGLVVVGIPIPVWVVKRARFWRERRKEKAARKLREKKEKEAGAGAGEAGEAGEERGAETKKGG